MNRLEELKKRASIIDKDMAILNSELTKLTDKLKKEFDIDISIADKYLSKIEGDSDRITRRINRLYSKAEIALKGNKKK